MRRLFMREWNITSQSKRNVQALGDPQAYQLQAVTRLFFYKLPESLAETAS